MKTAKYVVAILGLLVVAGVIAAAWFFFASGPKVNAAAKPGEVRWKLKVGMNAFGTAVVGDTVLCYASRVWTFGSNRLTACDAATGKRLWTKKSVGYGAASAMTMAGEHLVFSRQDYRAKIEAYDARTGKRKWACPWDLPNTWNALKRDDNTILAHGYEGIHAIELAPARTAWSYPNPVGTGMAPPAIAIDAGRVFFVTRDNKLHAVDAMTGQEAWNGDLGHIWVRTIAVSDGAVCIITQAGAELKAFDAAMGAARWDTGQKTWNTASIAVHAGRLYLADASNVVCLGLADGKEVWSTPFNTVGVPVYISVSGGIVYCGCQGLFAAFDAATGATLRQLPIEGRVVGAPAVSGDTVYFATDAGWLYAVAAEPEGARK